MAEQDTKEAPTYKLSEAAYIDDVLYTEGAEITYQGIPGHHMMPLNGAAKAMKVKHPSKYIDPILSMTNVTGGATA